MFARSFAFRSTAPSGAFSPADLSPAIWLEMDSGSLRGATSGTFAGDMTDETAVLAALEGDEFCTQWTDQSGNGRHFAQATGANQPAWLTNAETAFDTAALDFASSDLLTNGTGLANVASGFAVTVVFLADEVTSQSHLFNTQVDTTHRACIGVQAGEVRAHTTGTTTLHLSSGTISTGTKYIAHYGHDGATPFMRVNGAAQSGTNSLNNSSSDAGMRIGTRRPDLAQPFDGRMVAVIVRASAWTSDEMNSLDTYLGAKYGVTF